MSNKQVFVYNGSVVKLDSKFRKEIGRLGEDFALKHLQNNGFSVIAQNVVSWGGELDIVAVKNDLIYIVEVKTSKSQINPLEHINLKKLLAIKRAGEHYVRFTMKSKLPFVLAVVAVWLDVDYALKKLEFISDIEI